MFRWSQVARTKVDTFVEFPLNGLDMSQYLLRNLSSTRSVAVSMMMCRYFFEDKYFLFQCGLHFVQVLKREQLPV